MSSTTKKTPPSLPPHAYCYPTREAIKRDFDAQCKSKFIQFKKRGMTDKSFSYLTDLILSIHELQEKKLTVDIRDNCLTNKSLWYMTQLEDNGVKILASGNDLKADSLPPQSRIMVHSQLNFLAVQSSSSTDLLSRVADVDNRAALENLYKLQEGTSKKLDHLTDVVSSLGKLVGTLHTNVQHHQGIFDKMHKQIEISLARCIQQQVPNMYFDTLTKVDFQGTHLEKHEIDAALLSKDGSVLILGEAKHELTTQAFEQLDVRISAFSKSQKKNQLPSKLQAVKTVVGVVCADIVSDTKRREAREEGYVLLCKHDNYMIQDMDWMQELMKEENVG